MKTREARMVRKRQKTSKEHSRKNKLKAPAKRTSSKHQPKEQAQNTSQMNKLKTPAKRTSSKH
jgi:hypothetical protein